MLKIHFLTIIIKICLLEMCGRNNVGSKFGGFLEIPPLFRPTIISTAIISVQHKIDHYNIKSTTTT